MVFYYWGSLCTAINHLYLALKGLGSFKYIDTADIIDFKDLIKSRFK